MVFTRVTFIVPKLMFIMKNHNPQEMFDGFFITIFPPDHPTTGLKQTSAQRSRGKNHHYVAQVENHG